MYLSTTRKNGVAQEAAAMVEGSGREPRAGLTARRALRTVQYSLSARQMIPNEGIQRPSVAGAKEYESMLIQQRRRRYPLVTGKGQTAARRIERGGGYLLARVAGTAVAIPIVTTFLALGAALLMGHSLVHVVRHARGTAPIARRAAPRRDEAHR